MSATDNELPPEPPTVTPKLVPVPSNFLRTKDRKPASLRGLKREWRAVSGIGYHLSIPDLLITFDVTRIRQRFDETTCLLTVRAKFAGARTVADDMLSSADFNLCSLRARIERAKHLSERAHAQEIDWLALVEEVCHRVLAEESIGSPEIPLGDIRVPENEQSAEIEAGTLPLLRHHPTIWFGDGASGKSLFALYAAIDLAQSHNHHVLYLDWELDADSHAVRLRRFLGAPGLRDSLFYRRCDKPFIRDVNAIREIIARRKISFLVCDSLGFATEGAPESAEGATGYFRALRECGRIGSLHLAHMNRSEQGDQKPFGSIFWHAGARATWFIKRNAADDSDAVTVGFFHRKSNLGKLRPAFGRLIDFQEHATFIKPCDLSESEELAEKLPLWQRIKDQLNGGPMTSAAIADALEAKEDSVRRAAERMTKLFTKDYGADGIQRFRLVANNR